MRKLYYILLLFCCIIICNPINGQIKKHIPDICNREYFKNHLKENEIKQVSIPVDDFTVTFYYYFNIHLHQNKYNNLDTLRNGRIDLRRYDICQNPFLNIHNIESVYKAFVSVFKISDYKKIRRNFQKHVEFAYYLSASSTKNTLEDWLKDFSKDFFNIYIGIDNENMIKSIRYSLQNIKFFQTMDLEKMKQFEEIVLQSVSFTLITSAPPMGKFIEFQLSLDLYKLEEYYK